MIGVRVPRDEQSGELLTTYTITINGIGFETQNGLATDATFFAFPFTETFYVLNIDANAEYFSRNFNFRLQELDINFGGTTFLEDDFTGIDNDPPDATKWFTFSDQAQSEVDILNNDLNLFAESNGTAAALTDINIIFAVNDAFIFEYISPARPTINAGSVQYGGGWTVDNNANPITAEIDFGIRRNNTGILTLNHGTLTNQQIDLTDTSQVYQIILERTSATEYTSTFLKDDNVMATFTDVISHNIYKGALFVRSGNGAGQFIKGTVTSARIFQDSSFKINTYLARISEANQVVIEVSDVQEFTRKLPDIRTELSGTVIGAGKVIVEQAVTDSTGRTTMSFVVNKPYTLRLIDADNNVLATLDITIAPNQSTLFVYTSAGDIFPLSQDIWVSVRFGGSPAAGSIDINSAVIDIITTLGDKTIVSSITSYVINDDINRLVTVHPVQTNNTITMSGIPLNLDKPITIRVNVITQSASFWFETTFNRALLIGGVDYLNGVVRGRFKSDLGCSTGEAGSLETCMPTLILSVMAALMITASVAFTTRMLNVDMAGVLFLIVLAMFTYFYWVPLYLFGLLAFMGFFIMYGKGRN